MLPETMPAGSGTTLLTDPVFTEVVVVKFVPVWGVGKRSEIVTLPKMVVAPPFWAIIRGLRFVRTTLLAVKEPVDPLTVSSPGVACVSVAVKTEVAAAPVPRRNWMVPVKLSCVRTPPEPVTGAVLETLVKISVPGKPAKATFPMSVIEIVVPLVEIVVVLPDRVSVLTSFGLFVAPKLKIVSASAEVANASAAKPAIANRISEDRMVLILPV